MLPSNVSHRHLNTCEKAAQKVGDFAKDVGRLVFKNAFYCAPKNAFKAFFGQRDKIKWCTQRIAEKRLEKQMAATNKQAVMQLAEWEGKPMFGNYTEKVTFSETAITPRAPSVLKKQQRPVQNTDRQNSSEKTLSDLIAELEDGLPQNTDPQNSSKESISDLIAELEGGLPQVRNAQQGQNTDPQNSSEENTPQNFSVNTVRLPAATLGRQLLHVNQVKIREANHNLDQHASLPGSSHLQRDTDVMREMLDAERAEDVLREAPKQVSSGKSTLVETVAKEELTARLLQSSATDETDWTKIDLPELPKF